MNRVALSLALVLTTNLWADDLARLRAKLEQETDPTDRAKISVQIGQELLKNIQEEFRESPYEEGNQLLQDYLETMKAAYTGLQESGRDARRKPKGFKDLEIHLRKSQRTLRDIARTVPFSFRQPLRDVLQEMNLMRTELLNALMDIQAGDREGP